jgi:hypothetical protein
LPKAGYTGTHRPTSLFQTEVSPVPSDVAMKAFLSHSSKDKYFVREVAKGLGNVQFEYDEYTFEYVLNAEAIRRALARSELFVLFLSENSI